MPVTAKDISDAAERMGLAGRPVCVHSSLRSFGRVRGGAQAVIRGLLDQGCTVMVPTFTYAYRMPPPSGKRLRRNYPDDQWNSDWEDPVLPRLDPTNPSGADLVYSPDSGDISDSMGAVPEAVLAMDGRTRGSHPICSFAAIGPDASELIAGQSALEMYAPIRQLSQSGGMIVLMGVGLTAMSALHFAEQLAGRELFRKWANGPDGGLIEVAVGGQAHGFDGLNPALSPLERHIQVGESLWRVFQADAVLERASKTIREDDMATHCGYTRCRPCNDAKAGGPIIQ